MNLCRETNVIQEHLLLCVSLRPFTVVKDDTHGGRRRFDSITLERTAIRVRDARAIESPWPGPRDPRNTAAACVTLSTWHTWRAACTICPYCRDIPVRITYSYNTCVRMIDRQSMEHIDELRRLRMTSAGQDLYPVGDDAAVRQVCAITLRTPATNPPFVSRTCTQVSAKREIPYR